jgi:hypothetical protein
MGKGGKREFVQVLRLLETFQMVDGKPVLKAPWSEGPSALMPSNIWCCAASNDVLHGWT